MSSILQGTLASEERLRWLSETLTADGSVTIAAAAEALGVSDMTIRRDLAELEERGTARRVRGGATSARAPVVRRTPTTCRPRQGAHRGQARRRSSRPRASSRSTRRPRSCGSRAAGHGARPHGAHQRTRHVRGAPGAARRDRRRSPAAGSSPAPAASSARSPAGPPRSSRCRRSSPRPRPSTRTAVRWRRRSRRPR